MAGNRFLLQEINSFDWKSFPLTGNHFRWQEAIFFDKKPFILKETHSPGHDTVHSGKFSLLQEISSLHLFRLYISGERWDSCQVFRLRSKYFPPGWAVTGDCAWHQPAVLNGFMVSAIHYLYLWLHLYFIGILSNAFH